MPNHAPQSNRETIRSNTPELSQNLSFGSSQSSVGLATPSRTSSFSSADDIKLVIAHADLSRCVTPLHDIDIVSLIMSPD